MSYIPSRSLPTVAGQQNYVVAGMAENIPATVTVNGAAATFTTSVEVESGIRSLNITTPTITVSGQPIVLVFNQLDAQPTEPTLVSTGDGVDSGPITKTTSLAEVIWQSPVDIYKTVTVDVITAQTNLNAVVEVTNDPTAAAGWITLRGVNDLTGVPTPNVPNTSAVAYSFPVGGFKHCRLRVVSATASGTTLLHVRLSDEFTLVDVNVNGTVANNITAVAGGFISTSTHRLLAALATTNPTLIRGGAGRMYKIVGLNASAAVKYLKLFNKATAPVPGTDTPVVTIPLPVGFFNIDFSSIGISFTAGMGYSITGLNPDADVTALAAGDIVGLNIFIA